MATETEKQEHK